MRGATRGRGLDQARRGVWAGRGGDFSAMGTSLERVRHQSYNRLIDKIDRRVKGTGKKLFKFLAIGKCGTVHMLIVSGSLAVIY